MFHVSPILTEHKELQKLSGFWPFFKWANTVSVWLTQMKNYHHTTSYGQQQATKHFMTSANLCLSKRKIFVINGHEDDKILNDVSCNETRLQNYRWKFKRVSFTLVLTKPVYSVKSKTINAFTVWKNFISHNFYVIYFAKAVVSPELLGR